MMAQLKSHRSLAVAAGVALMVLGISAYTLFTTTGTAQVSGVGNPVAAAYVRADATIGVGTSNVTSAIFDSQAGQYEITIDGEDYFYLDYVTLVTLSADDPLIVSTSSVNGHLVVIVIDLDGNPVQADFQFVTYKP